MKFTSIQLPRRQITVPSSGTSLTGPIGLADSPISGELQRALAVVDVPSYSPSQLAPGATVTFSLISTAANDLLNPAAVTPMGTLTGASSGTSAITFATRFPGIGGYVAVQTTTSASVAITDPLQLLIAVH